MVTFSGDTPNFRATASFNGSAYTEGYRATRSGGEARIASTAAGWGPQRFVLSERSTSTGVRPGS